MAEKITPNHIPPHHVLEVFFDEGLIDMAIEIEMDNMREEVDRFWSGLYMASLPEAARQFMTAGDISIVDLLVIPTDYDVEAEVVRVLLTAKWAYPPDGNGQHGYPKQGYTTYMTFKMDGSFMCDSIEGELNYSPSMIPHISNLYAHTATWPEYSELQPENFSH